MTSTGAIEWLEGRAAIAEKAAAALKCRIEEVPARVAGLQSDLRESNQKLKAALTGGSSDAISSAIEGAIDAGGYKLVFGPPLGSRGLRAPKRLGYHSPEGRGAVACVVATVTEKGTPALLAAGTDDAVACGFKAGDIIKEISGLVGGRGGGKPTMAQAGGKDAEGIPAALDAARAKLGL